MSIRAHRVVEIKTEGESFNLRQSRKLVDFLDSEVQFSLYLTNGSGLVDVPISLLRRALKNVKKLELDPNTVKAVKGDIEAAIAAGDDYVQYFCY